MSGRTRKSAGSFNLPYSTLLRMGFAWPAGSPCGRWALTPPFHPYRFRGGLLFCGTFPGFAPAGVSPASCPAEPGLSSRALRAGGRFGYSPGDYSTRAGRPMGRPVFVRFRRCRPRKFPFIQKNNGLRFVSACFFTLSPMTGAQPKAACADSDRLH